MHSKQLIRQTKLMWPADEFAVPIVAGSILEKAHTDPSALMCTQWNYCQGRFEQGFRFVSLLYQASDSTLPIAAELIKN